MSRTWTLYWKGTGRSFARLVLKVMKNGSVPHYCSFCGLILPSVPDLLLHLDYDHTFWTQQYVESCEKAELANPSNKYLVAELINVQGMA